MVLCATTRVEAQSLSHKIMELESREADGAHIKIAQEASVTEAVRATEAAMQINKINGYRIVIYFDNEQYANDRATSVLNSFRDKYPNINSYLVYESPYFKVSVGDCVTMEEAIILLNTIIGDYPKAFPKREEIKVAQLQNVKHVPSEEPNSIEDVNSTDITTDDTGDTI